MRLPRHLGSDRLARRERAQVLDGFLNDRPRVKQMGRYRFTIDEREVDFWPAIDPERRTSDRLLMK